MAEGHKVHLTAAFMTREQAAYDAIRAAIIAGQWHPGESLVVSRIAIDLGISRIPVANAIKRLSSEGFLVLRPHKEAVIAPLDPAEVREIYLMRAALESMVMRDAASRATPADIAALHVLNDELGEMRRQPETTMSELRRVDRAFHDRMREIARMRRCAQLLMNLADQCEYYRACLLDNSRLAAPTPARHAALIAAVERHDPDEAAQLMETHVIEGMEMILASLADAR